MAYRERQEVIRNALKRRDFRELLTVRLLGEHTLEDAKTSMASNCFPVLDDEVHERWLWHGTTHKAVEAITTEDFQLTRAGSRAGTLYGEGIYSCECCTKADEYSQ